MNHNANAAQHKAMLLLGILWLAIGSLANAAPLGYVTLPGHVLRIPANAKYLGPASVSQQVNLAVCLPLRNQAALEGLIKRLYDPKDSLYAQYLTPTTFTQAYGPTESDYNAVRSYLLAKGLAITHEFSNRLIIDVQGSAGAVQNAFGVKLLQFQSASGRSFHSIDAEPLVPADLASKITLIAGLDTSIEVKPQLRLQGQPIKSKRSTFTGNGGHVGPLDITNAYGLSPASLTAAGLPALNGAGQTVGLVELNGGYWAPDITIYTQYYKSYFGKGYVPPLVNVSVDGYNTATYGDANEIETVLDIDCVLNVAPKLSKLVLFEGPNNSYYPLFDALNAAATDTTDTGTGSVVSVINVSYGYAETSGNQSLSNYENGILEETAAQGQTVFVSAGDYGAYGDYYNNKDLAVTAGDPAVQPLVTAVGGTTLSVTSSDAWSNEVVWNDCYVDGTPDNGIGGGGISLYQTIPDYQAAYIPKSNKSGYSTTMRNEPDVALNADELGSPYGIYLLDENGWLPVGGTSAAAPTWAGFMALANQERAAKGYGPVGLANPVLYRLASSSRYSKDFHDVTSGYIGVSTTSPVYSAAAGYDLASGWGSFNGANLISDMSLSNNNYILWNNSGQASLWNLSATGSIAASAFGPIAGWTPTMLSSDSNGNAYIVWNHTSDGEISVYKITPDLSLASSRVFGPVSGWTVKSIAIGPDGDIHILWNQTATNQISIWDAWNDGSGTVTSQSYGPISGYQAQQIAVDGNNNTRVLWSNSTANTLMLWSIPLNGSQTTQTFSPTTNWQSAQLAIGPDNVARVLVNYTTNHSATIWRVPASGTSTTSTLGPYTGWTAVGFAINLDGDSDVIWTSATNQMSIFDIGPTGTITSTAFGPYTGYRAIAVAAGI